MSIKSIFKTFLKESLFPIEVASHLRSVRRRRSRISSGLRGGVASWLDSVGCCHVGVVRGLLLELLLLELLLLRVSNSCWLLRVSWCWLLLHSYCCGCLCCCGLTLPGLDDVGVHHAVGPLGLLHEREDDNGRSRVVDNIANCNPILVTASSF